MPTTNDIIDWIIKQRSLLTMERETEVEETERQSSKRMRQASLVEAESAVGERYNLELEFTIPVTQWVRVGESISLRAGSGGNSGSGSPAADSNGAATLNPVRGVVSAIKNDKRIIVTADNFYTEWYDEDKLTVSKIADDVTFKRLNDCLGQLESLVQSSQFSDSVAKRVLEVAFGLSLPSQNEHMAQLDKLDFRNSSLNDSQREAIRFALTTNDIALVIGPPGTGKTTTVCELIRQAVEVLRWKVLVVAPSNIAIDTICERLAGKRLKMVRMGHPARLMDSVLHQSMDYQLMQGEHSKMVGDIRKELQQTIKKLTRMKGKRLSAEQRSERDSLRSELKLLTKEMRQREKQAVHDLIRYSQVILATTTGAADYYLSQHNSFDLVIVDEAAQALEAASWMALLKGKRAILCGDPNQLPPTILSDEAKRKGLDTTLMERLHKKHKESIGRMLTVQYRMNEEIMKWSSDEFYESRLVADESVAQHLLSDLDGVKEEEECITPLFMIDTAGCGFQESNSNVEEGESRWNENEAECVIKHVKKLLECGVKEDMLGVISPYAAQVQLIKTKLGEKSLIEVSTVDGFQGREKEAIVISMVRSNSNREVGFLSDTRRTNVAITRARRHVCVVADSDLMKTNEFLGRMITYFGDNADVRSGEDYI